MPPALVSSRRYDGTQVLNPQHANIVQAFISVSAT